MPLATLLDQQFFLLQSRITNEATRQHYRRAVRWLGEMLGHRPAVSDLTNDHLAALLRWLQDVRHQSPTTANGSLKCLCSLWRWCRDSGLIATGPRILPLRVPRRIPRALRPDELERLVGAANTMPGTIGQLPARVFWLTLLALEMDTGCRAAELLALRWEWLDWSTGWLIVPAEVRKGQHHDEAYGLRRETLDWLARIRRTEGLILAWRRHPSRYYQLWRELLERAGLPTGRHWKTQCLRRTFATLLAQAGGDPTGALGHADSRTTVEHYLDPAATRRRYAEVLQYHPLSGVPQ